MKWNLLTAALAVALTGCNDAATQTQVAEAAPKYDFECGVQFAPEYEGDDGIHWFITDTVPSEPLLRVTDNQYGESADYKPIENGALIPTANVVACYEMTPEYLADLEARFADED